ncbi:hypothetical protein N42HA_01413 [Lactococcus lactis]|nr:hypothetical protein [Lactococcus lactis]MDU0408401.1 hypothetical protein [Lactococcus lactis]
MADIMVDSVTTGIDLNETKAVEAINRLKSAVKIVLVNGRLMKHRLNLLEMLFCIKISL